jgi:hypothetical protein
MAILHTNEIQRTCKELSVRIRERFPDARLNNTCLELLRLADEIDKTNAWIKRPNFFIRGGSWICIIVLVYFVRFGFNERYHLDLLVASFLHDTIEDTRTSYSDLKEVFGETITEIVYCMSDEMGRNRKEKKEKTYPKIRSNPNSIILKVADRIANAEFSVNEKSKQATMYREEYNEFEYYLRVHSQIDLMWEHLHYVLFKDADAPVDQGITGVTSDVGEQQT